MSTVVVTGANRGIGLEFCRQFSSRGDTVIAVCRKGTPQLAALGVEQLQGIDVTDEESVGALAEHLSGRTIDILVNNAGILRRETLDNLDFDSIRAQFEVNALGPLRVTAALRANLNPGSKVAIITSRMGSIADNTSGSRYGYRMSKAAVNMAGASLAHDMRHSGVAVALLHPGFVKTDMTGGMGDVSTETSVRGLVARIDGLELSNSGTFWHAQGEELPW